MTAQVLIVDDDEGVRSMLVLILEEAGYGIRSAGTLSEGLRHLERDRFDLVIADSHLPDGDGLVIADVAKAKGATVVILTGFGAQVRPGHEEYNFLFKPIRPAELVRAVAMYLGAAAV